MIGRFSKVLIPNLRLSIMPSSFKTTELGGDELEIHLFAKAKNVNVILYDQVRNTFVKRHKFDAHSSNSETIHLLYHKTVGVNNAFEGSNQELTGGNDSSENVAGSMSSQDACFTLFMPKLYSVMKAFQCGG